MFCSPLIAYILICIALFIPYPRYSLTPINIIGNIVSFILLYYLCSVGRKRFAWAFVIIPLIFIAIAARRPFDNLARSYEEKETKTKK
jgi:nicotinamide riboside transporter PnuC